MIITIFLINSFYIIQGRVYLSFLILNKPLFYFGSYLVKVYSKLMLNLSVVFHFPIPSGAKIIVANHPTTSDPFILTPFSNGQASVLIKDVLFDVPVFGRYLKWSGHISVSKTQGKIAFEKALKLLKNGVTIIVFIEGDLSTIITKLNKPKTGAVRLALLSHLPIIPMGLSVKAKNIRNIKSVIKGITEWGRWYFKGPYAITIGKQINLKGNIKNRSQVRKLSSWLTQRISILTEESQTRIKE